jgi:pyruvate formate lyase activating enzyme
MKGWLPVGKDRMDRRSFIELLGRGALGAGLAPLAGRFGLDTVTGTVTQRTGNVSNVTARYWKPVEGDEIKCLLCPRHCQIRDGERGLCGARENVGGQYVSKVYGRPAAVKGDPMEKGPFFHFLPATKTLSLGTAGCNLTCLYCQSWQFAQRRPEQTDNETLLPADLVAQVQKYGLRSITFTYSEPIVAIEYVMDTAKLARAAGIRTCIHTAGSVAPEPLRDLTKVLDAINIDFKAYSAKFYEEVVGGHMDDVLQSIGTVAASDCWLELTNLVIPGYNDNPAGFRAMCAWIYKNVGPDVPLHVSRFFPAYRLRNTEATSAEALRDLRKIGFEEGLRYVYLGNMAGDPGESTYCPKCGIQLIRRIGYDVSNVGLNLAKGKCVKCGLAIPGLWNA